MGGQFSHLQREHDHAVDGLIVWAGASCTFVAQPALLMPWELRLRANWGPTVLDTYH